MKKLITLITLLLSVTVFSQNYIDASDTVIENVQEIETITDSTKVAVIDNNGIMKYVEKGDISEEVTQYFLSITEGGNTGYGTKYRKDNPDNYGDIGANAIDLGFSIYASSTVGARGGYSIISGGLNNTASGQYSIISGGWNNTAGGNWSTVSGGRDNTSNGQLSVVSGGRGNKADSFGAWFGGHYSTIFTGQTYFSWVPTDILFNIGNGTSDSSRSNALSLFKNGRLELPSYGKGTFTGTATKLLAVDADGKVIEEDLPSGTSLTVTDYNEVSVSGVEIINFTNATVTDNEDGSVDVTVPVGITVVDDDNTETYNDIEALIFEGVTIIDNEDGSVTIPISGGGSSLTVTDDDTVDVSDVDTINFIGATVTDNEDGSVDVEFSGGGEPGGSTGEFQWNNGGVFAGLSNLTTDGTNVTLGGTPVLPSTITMGSNRFIRSGAHDLTLTTTGTSNITFPSGTNTVATLAGLQTFTSPKFFSAGLLVGGSNNNIELTNNTTSSGSPVAGGTTYAKMKMQFNTGTNLFNNIGFTGFLIEPMVVNEGASATHHLASALAVRALDINNHTSGTTNLSATVWIEGESTGTASPLESYSLYIASGKTRVSDEGITFSDTGVINKVKVTISPLDFRNISSNPIELIPAQGAGTVVNVIGVTAFLDYNSAAFNFTGEIYLRVGNNPSWSMNNTDINVVADNYISFKPPTQTSSSVSNSPVVITSSANSLGGDSDVTIIVTYTVDQF